MAGIFHCVYIMLRMKDENRVWNRKRFAVRSEVDKLVQRSVFQPGLKLYVRVIWIVTRLHTLLMMMTLDSPL